MYVYMAIHWTTQTYDVEEDETKVLYFVRHDADAILSFRVSVEPMVIGYRTYTERIDFMNGCLTVFAVIHETAPDVRVSLVWT